MINRLLPLLFLLIAACSSSVDVSSGSSTTTGNPIVVGVVSFKGEPLANAEVYLLPTDYIYSEKDSLIPIKTDSVGGFTTDSLEAGTYRITILADDTGSGSVFDIELTGDTVPVTVNAQEMGTISGDSSAQKLTVPGTPFAGEGAIVVPAGEIPVLVTLDETGVVADTVSEKITVQERDTTVFTGDVLWYTLAEAGTFIMPDSLFSLEKDSEGTLYLLGRNELKRKRVDAGWQGKSFKQNCNDLAVIDSDQSWIASDSGLISVAYPGYSTLFSSGSQLMNDTILALFHLKDTLVLATPSGVQLLYGDSLWETVPFSNGLSGVVVELMALTSNRIVVVTENNGVWFLDRAISGDWNRITAFDAAPYSTEPVLNVTRANDSSFWLSTSSIVSRYDLSSLTLTETVSAESTFLDTYYDETTELLWILEEDYLAYGEEDSLNSVFNFSKTPNSLLPVVNVNTRIGKSKKAGEILVADSDEIVAVSAR